MSGVPHSFGDPTLLPRALTHPSAGGPSAAGDNQRLEFLGDSVLQLVASEFLMEACADWPEGKLSRARARLVNAGALARFAEAWEIGRQLRLGKGERQSRVDRNVNVLADAFEAVVAAIYLDGGLPAARAAVVPLLGPALAALETLVDPRSALLEWAQARGLPEPAYEVVNTEGPDHARTFSVTVAVSGRSFGPGTGPSKRAASAAAARLAMDGLAPG